MKSLTLTLALALLLTGCGHRQLGPKPSPHSEPISIVVPPALPGQTPAPIKIGRKAVVSIFYGTATVTTNVAGKKAVAGTGASLTGDTKAKAGSIVAKDSAKVDALTGSGNLNHQQGNGNHAEQTKQDTTKEAEGVGATIAHYLSQPIGMVAAGIFVLAFCYGVYRLWPILFRRRSASTNEPTA